MELAGPAYTVRGRARTDPRFAQMDNAGWHFRGCVVVIDPGDEGHAAHWGELISHTAEAKGATGVVIAGVVRDTPQILEVGFPCLHRYHSPLTARWRFDNTDFDVPIRIGGIAIAPGDFILGDVDGVLVIPAAVVDDVVDQASRSASARKSSVQLSTRAPASASCSTVSGVLRTTGSRIVGARLHAGGPSRWTPLGVLI